MTTMALYYAPASALAPSPGNPGEGWGEGEFEFASASGNLNHPHPTVPELYEDRERGPEAIHREQGLHR
jgi:hypothetical protein